MQLQILNLNVWYFQRKNQQKFIHKFQLVWPKIYDTIMFGKFLESFWKVFQLTYFLPELELVS